MAVCLHCLHAARLEARERRQRAIMRFAVWTLSLAIVVIVGAAGVNAATRHPDEITPRNSKRSPGQAIAAKAPARTDSAVVTVASAVVMQQGIPAATPAAPVADSSPPAAASPTSTPAVPANQAVQPAAPAAKSTVATDSSMRARIGPIIPQGRTDLRDSLFAVRSADTVVVHFDTSPSRTRRADKFEAIVRQTLDVVFGPIADSVLAGVPSGRLVAPNELVTTLPSRGIHLTGPHGTRLVLWPETRPGRDGPLVVAYRTLVER